VSDDPASADDEATKVIIEAVYPALLSEPTSVRTRAQTAYTIASAIAAALITAGILGDIDEFGALVQVFGVLAVSAWMVTAALHIDISRRVFKVPRADDGGLITVDDFVSQVLTLATDEADALEEKLHRAAIATYIALALTALALLFALLEPPDPAPKPESQLTLSGAGSAAIATQCPEAGNTLTGKLMPGSLSDDFAVLVVKNTCGKGDVTIRIPPRYIVAVGSNSD
jgi:hypothetical protein